MDKQSPDSVNQCMDLGNAQYIPSWYHLVINSASGSPKKPPTSAPLQVRPEIPSAKVMGIDFRKWCQSAALSPVQTGPMRCVPAKNALLKTSGRSLFRNRNPSAVAAW